METPLEALGRPVCRASNALHRTSAHDEAIARLVDAIETGQRLAVIRAGEGLGKSCVLTRAVAETKGPGRIIAKVGALIDGPTMIAGLASGLGIRVEANPTRATAWKALTDAVRLCRWQKIQAVLVIDDCQLLDDRADRLDLDRLAHLDPNPAMRLTVVQSFRDLSPEPQPWQLVIGLLPMLRAETSRFLAEKLAAAGRTEPAFTPRAVARLHDLSGGVPRGLERLGSLALMAGAVRGLELVTPDVITASPANVFCRGPNSPHDGDSCQNLFRGSDGSRRLFLIIEGECAGTSCQNRFPRCGTPGMARRRWYTV